MDFEILDMPKLGGSDK